MAIRFLDEEEPTTKEDIEELQANLLDREPASDLKRPLTALATGGISEIARQIPKVAELAQKPTEGAITERETVDQLISAMAKQFGAEAVNTALLGLPGFAARKSGIQLEEPQTVGEEAAARTGEIAGFALGAPAKIFGATSKAVSKVAPGVPSAIRAGLGAAATGAAETGEEGDLLQLGQRGKRAFVRGTLTAGTVLAGQAIGALTSPRQIVRNVKNFFNQPELAQRARREFGLIGRKASRLWRNTVRKIEQSSPDKTMSLQKSTDLLFKKGIVKTKKILSVLKRSETLQQSVDQLFENPELANKMTLRQSQDLINAIESNISQAKLAGRGVRPSDVNLLKLVKELKRGQSKIWPEMRTLRKEYGNIVGPFRKLKNQTTFARFLNNMKNQKSIWNDKEAQQFIKANLSKQLIDDIGGIVKINQLLKALKIVGGAAIIGTAIQKTKQPVESVVGISRE
jgi:hypothetical protein